MVQVLTARKNKANIRKSLAKLVFLTSCNELGESCTNNLKFITSLATEIASTNTSQVGLKLHIQKSTQQCHVAEDEAMAEDT
jgi:hypothetical protein